MSNPERGSHLIQVAKPVPYPDFFSIPAPEQKSKLQPYERAWNRWDATRRLNPFIEEQGATGFEGYFVGIGLVPEEVAQKIAEMGSQTIQGIKRLHALDPSYLRRVWRVARGETYDDRVLQELNACLMANIGRLRMQVLPQLNKEGDSFRTEVARMLQGQTMAYQGEHGKVEEHMITVPAKSSSGRRIAVTEGTFTKDQLREGYAFMKLLGRAGYPLLRLSLAK